MLADVAGKVLQETEANVIAIYHFVADATKTSITPYHSNNLVDLDKLKTAAIAHVATAAGKSVEEVTPHVTAEVTPGDTVSRTFVMCHKSGIRSPVHGSTTGYDIKIPIQFDVTPATFQVTYDDGQDKQQSPAAHVLQQIDIVSGPGQIYTWWLRSLALHMAPTAVIIGGETGYKFNVELTDLIGWFRPDPSGCIDQVTVHPDGTISDPAGPFLEAVAEEAPDK